MPQGKGTYGSQVGRPPKKDKQYAVGGSVDPFSGKNPKGVPVTLAKKDLSRKETFTNDDLKKIEIAEHALEQATADEHGIPMANAQERSQKFAMGGKVGACSDGMTKGKKK